MKKLTILLLSALMLFVFSACAGERLLDSSFAQSALNPVAGLSMRTEQSAYPIATESITVIIENQTEWKGSFGDAFTLQIRKDGVWKTIPFTQEGGVFFEDSTLLPSRKSVSVQIRLSRADFSFRAGEYRVVIEVYLHGSSSNKCLLSAEFQLHD